MYLDSRQQNSVLLMRVSEMRWRTSVCRIYLGCGMQDSAGEENATNNVPHGSESFIEGRCAVCAVRCSLSG